VDLKNIQDFKQEAVTQGFKLTVDESPMYGGSGAGPNPLSYFITGAAACLMNQYIRLATASDVLIDDLEVTAQGLVKI